MTSIETNTDADTAEQEWVGRLPAARGALICTVAGREVSVKLHDKGFIGSTVFFLLVVAVAIGLPVLLDSGPDTYRIGVTPPAQVVAEAAITLGTLPDGQRPPGLAASEVMITDVAADAEFQQALSDDGLAAVLSTQDGRLVITAKESVPNGLVDLLTAANEQVQVTSVIADAGLTAQQVQQLRSPTPPEVRLAEPPPSHTIPPELLVVVFGFLFYYSVLTFGISIAQSVVEEKQSRVVELLVAAVPVRWLLAGKVAGNGLMAITQVVLVVGVGVAGLALTGRGEVVSDVGAASGWFVVFFVLGFLMLACLWAVAGSLASRIEDLQSTTLVMQIAVMVPFFSAILIMEDSTVQRVLSYVPLTAPLMMPSRVVHGTAEAWEPWVAIVIVLLTAALLIGIGARIYAGSVLNTSRRTSVLAAWRNGRLKSSSPVGP
jgi:ABC-2 type transport system permease protein